jgi:glycosyltransferase involved in cell wall biosynthesis
MPFLTIGLPTYNDFDGMYFTVLALRMYQNLNDVELLVVDNFGCDTTRSFIAGLPGARYERFMKPTGTAVAKNLVFSLATGDVVLCIDSHVLLAPRAVIRLSEYCRANPSPRDLLQGPLWLDDLHASGVATHLSPTWSDGMHGQWATDQRGIAEDAPPFEIVSQGMGLFAHRRDTWPGFNPMFRGFGGEEGYLQEKVRQRGGRVLCLPFLRWVHRFQRPYGAPYNVRSWDKCRNALIGHLELGLDPRPMVDHFRTLLPHDVLERVVTSVQDDLAGVNEASFSRSFSDVRAQLREMISTEPAAAAEVTIDETPPRG